MKSNITFVIFTYNEEARIEWIIKNLIGFGKVLLADNKSTDRTQEIGRSFGCDILIRPEEVDYPECKKMDDWVNERVDTDWVCWSYADEMIEKDALDEILRIISLDKYDIINIDRKNYYYGSFCHDLYHSRTNKIFKKHAVDFTNNPIHSMGKPTVPAERIYILPDKYFVHHFISYDASTFLNATNRYTNFEVNTKYNAKTSVLKAVLYLLYFVLKSIFIDFIFGKGYKAGYKGIALAEMLIFYSMVKNMKHFEHDNGLSKAKIEEMNNGYREAIYKKVINVQ